VNRLEDDIRAVLRSQAEAMQVPEPHPEVTTVRLVGFERTPTQPESRNHWPILSVAAAAVAAAVVGGLVIATRTDDPKRVVPAAQPTTTVAQPASVAQPPVEFTACVGPGPVVAQGTEERSQVSLPDGEMTIRRERGSTWQSTVRDVSDPRLDGTWYNTSVGDEYTLPGDDPSPDLGMYPTTHRIENDEGAWEGSFLVVNFDGDESWGPLALIGEGAYEGLTAVATMDFGGTCSEDRPNTRGYIIEGSVPAPPVPQTGQ
jgi:hypothetical protein